MERMAVIARTGLLGATGAALLVPGLFAPILHAQGQSAPQGSLAATMIVSGRAAPPASSPQVVREIDDPSNGNRWLLLRDWNCPGGPGRLLLLASSSVAARHAAPPEKQSAPQNPPFSTPALAANAFVGLPSAALSIAAPVAPIIRPGDALIVEEQTPILDARLTATSLGTAPVGAMLTARLEIGGKVVRVRALGPGRATLDLGLDPEFAPALAPDTGTEP
jgi:hypothetical protein